ncbi:flagellar biosynthetic protein FliO [Liquorilactobacillus satsumensis]|uniref:flagellar biosynthetic protein FliO n=1 Tax=Liquorilactobacillus satsumensis TaxID=259059 RepID=UPI0039ED9BE3
MDIYFSVFKTIIFLVVIIYLINITLKLLNRYSNQRNTTFRILQKISVSKTSALGIVQIIDKYYVMSFSEQQNQIIKELTAEESARFLRSIAVSPTKKTDFAVVLKEMVTKLQADRKRK